MAKLSIVIIVFCWMMGAFSSYVFPWYVHALPFVAVGFLLVKLSRPLKEKSEDNSHLGRVPDDERYII